MNSILCPRVLLLTSLLVLPVISYRIKGSEDEAKPFVPYEKGFVGDRNKIQVQNARINQGYEDFAMIEAAGGHGHNRLQDCPGMVGPLDDDKYYCTSKLNGYCDRRSGTCFCNQGYDGSSCNECDPWHHLIGGLCYEKTFDPNESSSDCDDNSTDGGDCELVSCSKFHEHCTRCNTEGCLECIEGYGVNKRIDAVEQCESCQRFDPRCTSCSESACLSCTDLLLFSIRRSGRRPHDPILPPDELTRQLSRSIPFGSQESEVFDEAEHYDLVDSHLVPLDAYSVACHQGTNNDDSFECSRVTISHKICGHKGVISFVSPEYQVYEDDGEIRLTIQRSGGGAGVVSVSYDIQDITTDKYMKDVSSSAMYTASRRITFHNHEG
jgi:hypothetical protein